MKEVKGKNERYIFPPDFLSALLLPKWAVYNGTEQSQDYFYYLFNDKEANNFPTCSASIFNCSLIKHAVSCNLNAWYMEPLLWHCLQKHGRKWHQCRGIALEIKAIFKRMRFCIVITSFFMLCRQTALLYKTVSL